MAARFSKKRNDGMINFYKCILLRKRVADGQRKRRERKMRKRERERREKYNHITKCKIVLASLDCFLHEKKTSERHRNREK